MAEFSVANKIESSRRNTPFEEFRAQPDRFTASLMTRCGLFSHRAGIHIDFHAHRYFNDPWGLPSHFGLLAYCGRDFKSSFTTS
jgi:hypothetical protein